MPENIFLRHSAGVVRGSVCSQFRATARPRIDRDGADYTAYCGGWDVGRIHPTRRGGFEQHGRQVPLALVPPSENSICA